MKVYKLYDAYCETCDNWYGAMFEPPYSKNKGDAIKEMKKNGWKEKDGKTLCHRCNE